jgi:hypothetical protein
MFRKGEDLRSLSQIVKYFLPIAPKPVMSVLNKYIFGIPNGDYPEFKEQSKLMQLVKKELDLQNINILKHILSMIYSFTVSAAENKTEALDLLDTSKKLELVVSEFFACNFLDDPKNCLQLLLPDTFIPANEDALSISYRLLSEPNSLVNYCLANDMRALFDKPQVNNLIADVFLRYHRGPKGARKFTHGLRSRPVLAMMVEMISKLFTLWFIIAISIYDYGALSKLEYTVSSRDNEAFSSYEYLLAVMIVADCFFEIGQIFDEENDDSDGKSSLRKYSFQVYTHLSNEWNFVDFLSLITLILWLLVRIFGDMSVFSVARVALSLSAIPTCFGLLRYLCVYQPLGELVILVKGMTWEVLNFVFIYLVSILGFGIAFYGLFQSTPDFYNAEFSFLSLFSLTLGNLEYSSFATNSEVVNALGIILAVLFVVFTTVILLNLLIAQMSNVYADIKCKANQEWSFMYAKLTKDYLVRENQSSLRMLPPPLNLVIIFVDCIQKIAFQMEIMIRHQCCSTQTLQRVDVEQHHDRMKAHPRTRSIDCGYDEIYPEGGDESCNREDVGEVDTRIEAASNLLLRISWSATWSNIIFSIIAGTPFRSYYILKDYFEFFTSKDFADIGCCRFVSLPFHIIRLVVESTIWSFIAPLFNAWNEMRQLKEDKSPEYNNYHYIEWITSGSKQNQRQVAKNILSEEKVLFTDLDKERIMRPLKPHLKSITNDELVRLESNLSSDIIKAANKESMQIREGMVKLENTIETILTTHKKQVSDELFIEMRELVGKVDTLERSLNEIVVLLKQSAK